MALRSGRRVSNPRPSAWEADALPAELRPRGSDSRTKRRATVPAAMRMTVPDRRSACPCSAAVAGLSAAASPRASLPDIEDEVMCPTCGTPLEPRLLAAGRAPARLHPRADRRRAGPRSRSRTRSWRSSARTCSPRHDDDGLRPGRLPGADRGGRRSRRVAIVFGLLTMATPAAGPRTSRRPELSPADSARLEQDLSRYDP